MDYKISVLSGDGNGSVLAQSALDILSAIGVRYGHSFKFLFPLIGGVALEHTGVALPQDTIDTCAKCDAIILGALGGAKWKDNYGYDRAKKSAIQLIHTLNLFLEVTPIVFSSTLKNYSPLKNKLINDFTIFIVKESIGNILKGEQGFRDSKQGEQAYFTEVITIQEIEQIAKSAYELAVLRNLPVVSVDMADQTENGKLWRKIVSKVSKAYPDTKTTHMLIDECIFNLSENINNFGVILSSNLIGQIITAHLASLTGAIQSLATANIGTQNGVYSAYYTNPDLTKEMLNPIGIILGSALMLSQSCKLSLEAKTVEQAVKKVLQNQKPISMGGNLNCNKFTEQIALEIINSKD